mmetsp:Transcript_23656/g.44686  ORF Transcript_23656/g.44686 Transcript_23656/m.44686 type:complete len:260 (-) Transcript_23656:188-967(-)
MIHCFEAVSHGCEAVGKCSSGICTACGRVCSAGPDCLAACCAPFADICNRPLGCYVGIALATNLPAAILAYQSSTLYQVQNCTLAPMLNFCYGAIALSVLNAAFAIYLQRRLVNALELGEGGARGMFQEASTIVLYDFVFCFYVIIFAAGVFLCFCGIGWWQTCRVNSWNPFWTAVLLLLYAFWTGFFSCCWGMTLGCWGGLEGLGLSSSASRLFFGAPPRAQAAPHAPPPPQSARAMEMRADVGPTAAQAFQASAPPR